ncbi:hypothetical protein HYDPIDRAFT_32382 [Hydnomerulius pinastri MD-312]|uniref:Unplaced genomic scaffold scaffold_40, whole genome shotgun sequence n=1 Tax=Hydnomerulius pinastri MD-312 TaxID=994086 RepID=A0A0C9W2Q1_9AGAM|nr:hypothetical protein HYDPIDRAFT_32382 [Hydnomerulius pinastri MD-312]
MAECLISDKWPDQHEILAEIENFFLPQNKRDWARSQIQSCKQGNLRVDEYMSKWLSLYRQSKISEEHAVYLLEINTNPRIIKQVFILGGRADTVNAYLERIQMIRRAQESFLMFQPSPRPRDAPGVTTRLGLRPTEGRANRWTSVPPLRAEEQAPRSATSAAKGDTLHAIGKGKGREVRSTSAANETAPQSQADFKQMDFEEAKAFFYDMQVAEMKSQGKGFGP